MIRIKYFLTFFGMTFLLVSFSNCGSSQTGKANTFETDPPFTISEIYTQKWVAGVRDGGSGTNMYVTFSGLTDGIRIEQFYFKKKSVAAKEKPNLKSTYMGYFKNEMKRDVIMDENPINEAKNTPADPFPFDLKDDEAVIQYSINGESKYLRISNILEKPLIAYPSTNPNGRN